jgi:hypothetical protein
VILVIGIVLGLMAGYVRAWLHKQPYSLPAVQHVGLVLLAFVPQVLVFFVPQSSRSALQLWAGFILPLSLGILVLFVWLNRHLQGFWLLGLGLLLNFVVIATNGGLMPISPETLQAVHGTLSQETIARDNIGNKSIVLPAEETRLEWLADRFLLPDQWPIQFAFSLGDVFLVAGAIWALWVGGAGRLPAVSVGLERQPYSAEPEGSLERR